MCTYNHIIVSTLLKSLTLNFEVLEISSQSPWDSWGYSVKFETMQSIVIHYSLNDSNLKVLPLFIRKCTLMLTSEARVLHLG